MNLQGTDSDVQALYQQLLGRTGRPDEIAFWVQQANNGMSMDSIVQSFVGSPERQTYVSEQVAQQQAAQQAAQQQAQQQAAQVAAQQAAQLQAAQLAAQQQAAQQAALVASQQSVQSSLSTSTLVNSTPTGGVVTTQVQSATPDRNKLILYGALGLGAVVLLKRRKA